MKAITVQPGVEGSVRFEDVPEPDESTGSILVEAVAVGVCGTDVEIASGALRLGAAGAGAADPRPRVAGPGRRPGPEQRPAAR